MKLHFIGYSYYSYNQPVETIHSDITAHSEIRYRPHHLSGAHLSFVSTFHLSLLNEEMLNVKCSMFDGLNY